MQKGAGLSSKSAKTKDKAVKAFSPPDSWEIVEFFFPGGVAIKAIPESRGFASTITNSALPPPNKIGKSSFNFSLTALKLVSNFALDSASIFLIATCSFSRASSRSLVCSLSSSNLADSASISSGAARLIAPIEIILDCMDAKLSASSLLFISAY